jgi:osmotically-inducible protein OsmY
VSCSPAFSGDRDAEQRTADARQKVYIRRAFNEDAGLAPHAGEVWVEVRGTTAILSGKVPSPMLRQRAVYLAGQVKGIAEVRGDDLQVIAPDGVPDLPSPFPEGMPPRGALAGSPRDGHTTQVPIKADPPAAELPRAPVSLLPPMPVSSGAETPTVGVEILQPRPLPDAPDLASAVEALRRKDDRFRRVSVEVRQKSVYLRGTVARWGDVNDLANGVRRLPGVEAVILDNVRVDGSGGR